MLPVIRSNHKEIVVNWHGQYFWFSPNVKVQRISVEGNELVFQVDSEFRAEITKSCVAVISDNEDISKVKEPERVLSVIERIKAKNKKS